MYPMIKWFKKYQKEISLIAKKKRDYMLAQAKKSGMYWGKNLFLNNYTSKGLYI